MRYRRLRFFSCLILATLPGISLLVLFLSYLPPAKHLPNTLLRSCMLSSTVRIRTSMGGGSGVLISPNLVLTAAHVVDDRMPGNPSVEIRPSGIRAKCWVPAVVIKRDPAHDLALLALAIPAQAPGIQFLDHKLAPGSLLYLAGAPGRAAVSITSGYLSKRYKKGPTGVPVWQCSNVAYYGNSGGPVFDRHGRLVGITVAGTAPNATYFVGISFIRNFLR